MNTITERSCFQTFFFYPHGRYFVNSSSKVTSLTSRRSVGTPCKLSINTPRAPSDLIKDPRHLLMQLTPWDSVTSLVHPGHGQSSKPFCLSEHPLKGPLPSTIWLACIYRLNRHTEYSPPVKPHCQNMIVLRTTVACLARSKHAATPVKVITSSGSISLPRCTVTNVFRKKVKKKTGKRKTEIDKVDKHTLHT